MQKTKLTVFEEFKNIFKRSENQLSKEDMKALENKADTLNTVYKEQQANLWDEFMQAMERFNKSKKEAEKENKQVKNN